MIPPGKNHSVRLCATFVRIVNVPGRYGDGYGGHGLSLLVTPRKSGGFSKTWAQAISPNGAKISLGLGSYPVVTLAMAREKALANARAIAEGRDPRRRMHKVPTFEKANETVVAIHARHWKSGRTEGQWRASMRDYVLPRLARKRVDAVTTADVMAVLLPIWSTKRVTAGRVRQRIGAVMKWAVAHCPSTPTGMGAEILDGSLGNGARSRCSSGTAVGCTRAKRLSGLAGIGHRPEELERHPARGNERKIPAADGDEVGLLRGLRERSQKYARHSGLESLHQTRERGKHEPGACKVQELVSDSGVARAISLAIPLPPLARRPPLPRQSRPRAARIRPELRRPRHPVAPVRFRRFRTRPALSPPCPSLPDVLARQG